MKQRRTIEDLNRLAIENEHWKPKGWQPTVYKSPDEAGIHLFVTSSAGCLTHITRWVSDTPKYTVQLTDERTVTHPARRNIEALCGVGSAAYRNFIAIDPADEMFGCHACIARAEKYGLPTFNLIPATGCDTTGGQRFKRRPRLTDDQRAALAAAWAAQTGASA